MTQACACARYAYDMQTRASQALAKAFRTRGAQARLAERTGISPTRLSRLADGGDTTPNLQTSLRLKDDPEIPVDPSWWTEAPLPEEEGPEVRTEQGGHDQA